MGRVIEKKGRSFELGTVYIWAAGSSYNSNGGWCCHAESVWVDDSGEEWWAFRRFWDVVKGPTDGKRMDLLAAIVALSELKRDGTRVVLYTQSEYLIDGASKLPEWWANGWRRPDEEGGPIVNLDMWMHVHNLLQRHQVDLVTADDDDDRMNNVAKIAAWHAQVDLGKTLRSEHGYNKDGEKERVRG